MEMIPDGFVFSCEKAEPEGDKKNPLENGQKQPDYAKNNEEPPGNLFRRLFEHPIPFP